MFWLEPAVAQPISKADMEASAARTAFEQNGPKRILAAQAKAKRDEIERAAAEDLERRKYKLALLLEAEQRDYEDAVRRSHVTPKMRLQTLASRADELKRQNEAVRNAYNEAAKEAQFRANTDELRTMDAQAHAMRIAHHQEHQMAMKRRREIMTEEIDAEYDRLLRENVSEQRAAARGQQKAAAERGHYQGSLYEAQMEERRLQAAREAERRAAEQEAERARHAAVIADDEEIKIEAAQYSQKVNAAHRSAISAYRQRVASEQQARKADEAAIVAADAERARQEELRERASAELARMEQERFRTMLTAQRAQRARETADIDSYIMADQEAEDERRAAIIRREDEMRAKLMNECLSQNAQILETKKQIVQREVEDDINYANEALRDQEKFFSERRAEAERRHGLALEGQGFLAAQIAERKAVEAKKRAAAMSEARAEEAERLALERHVAEALADERARIQYEKEHGVAFEKPAPRRRGQHGKRFFGY